MMIPPDYLRFGFTLFAWVVLLYAGYWDYKTRTVPNWIWIISAFVIPASLSLRDWSWELVGLLVVGVWGVLMLQVEAWGGADSKAVLWAAAVSDVVAVLLAALLAGALMRGLGRWSGGPYVTWFAGIFGGVVISHGILYLL